MQNVINIQQFLSTHPIFFISIIVWSLAWKGFALWKAAENKSFLWFTVLLLINTLGLLEIIYLFLIEDKKIKEENPIMIPEAVIESQPEKEVIKSLELETKTDEIINEEQKTEKEKEEIKQEIIQ